MWELTGCVHCTNSGSTHFCKNIYVKGDHAFQGFGLHLVESQNNVQSTIKNNLTIGMSPFIQLALTLYTKIACICKYINYKYQINLQSFKLPFSDRLFTITILTFIINNVSSLAAQNKYIIN